MLSCYDGLDFHLILGYYIDDNFPIAHASTFLRSTCTLFLLGKKGAGPMKRIIVLPMVVILVALAALLGNVRVAHADNPPGYDIEVQMLYCINDDRPCNTIQSIRNSLYIQVEAVSFHPGAINGTPDAVDFTCGRAYIDQQGMFHDIGASAGEVNRVGSTIYGTG